MTGYIIIKYSSAHTQDGVTADINSKTVNGMVPYFLLLAVLGFGKNIEGVLCDRVT